MLMTVCAKPIKIAQDTTWRVRRAAIKVYHELIKVQASNYKQIMAACFDHEEIILTRLDEKN